MEILLSEEQIQDLIEKSMPDIKKSVVEHVASRMSWTVSDMLATHLLTNKEMLAGVAKETAPKLAQLFGEAMADSIKKNLESSYNRQKIFEAMLK